MGTADHCYPWGLLVSFSLRHRCRCGSRRSSILSCPAGLVVFFVAAAVAVVFTAVAAAAFLVIFLFKSQCDILVPQRSVRCALFRSIVHSTVHCSALGLIRE